MIRKVFTYLMLLLLCLCFISCALKCYECYKDFGPPFNRGKRVIGGSPVLDMDSDYKAVGFVVWMSAGHNCDALSYEDYLKLVEAQRKGGNLHVTLNDPFSPCAADARFNICGGSLLTSTIVQTACHCVADFEGAVDGFQKPVTVSVWEEMYDIYPGAIRIQKVTGAKAKFYHRHPACIQHESSSTILHDYGLIVLRNPLAANEINYAPVYTIATLAQLWSQTMATNSVCLNVGYGRYRLLENQKPSPENAPVLLHGWIRMMDWKSCYERTSLPKNFVGPRWNYRQNATWFCTTRLPNSVQHQGRGDSGTPVTCNNHYIGVTAATWHSETEDGDNILWEYQYSISMSTAFSVFENSAEYRKVMILTVGSDELDSKINLFNYRPTTKPIRMYRALFSFSNCQAPLSVTLRAVLLWVASSLFA